MPHFGGCRFTWTPAEQEFEQGHLEVTEIMTFQAPEREAARHPSFGFGNKANPDSTYRA